jgi:hypothetical protein
MTKISYCFLGISEHRDVSEDSYSHCRACPGYGDDQMECVTLHFSLQIRQGTSYRDDYLTHHYFLIKCQDLAISLEQFGDISSSLPAGV